MDQKPENAQFLSFEHPKTNIHPRKQDPEMIIHPRKMGFKRGK
jgi:hypothetical protein